MENIAVSTISLTFHILLSSIEIGSNTDFRSIYFFSSLECQSRLSLICQTTVFGLKHDQKNTPQQCYFKGFVLQKLCWPQVFCCSKSCIIINRRKQKIPSYHAMIFNFITQVAISQTSLKQKFMVIVLKTWLLCEADTFTSLQS